MTYDDDDLQTVLDTRTARGTRALALKRLMKASWQEGWDASAEEHVEMKAKLDLAITALRGFEELYTEIIENKEPPTE